MGRLNTIMRYRIAQLLLGLCLVVGFAQAAQLFQSKWTFQGNKAQLNEMSRQVLRRVELSVDYAIVTLGEQLEGGISICGHDGVMAAKNVILMRGLLKDIEVLREPYASQCSALGNETIAIDEFLQRFPTKNPNIALQVLSQKTNGLIRVRWSQEDNLTLGAILSFDTLLYDVLPASLRENSGARIVLGDTYTVARYGADPTEVSESDVLRFNAQSERFPVNVELIVTNAELAQWNQDSKGLAYGVGALIGLLMGMAISIHFSRPITVIEKLESAIKNGELKPYFQPTFSLADRSVIGCEVLVRWEQPDGTRVSPNSFIPLLESTGLIVPMTERLFADSFAILKPIVAGRSKFKVAVNVAPDHFVSEGFLAKLDLTAKTAGFAREMVVIELTERQSVQDADKVAIAANAARALGYRIALDDTGSGHNGLAHVQDLPLDIVKIDKKFVDLVGTNAVAKSIILMLVRLAKDIGASTIAEGIETEAQYHELAAMGVSDGQGYLIAPALDGLAFLAFLNKHERSLEAFDSVDEKAA
jgi:c-di-GMP phosphodiesterase